MAKDKQCHGPFLPGSSYFQAPSHFFWLIMIFYSGTQISVYIVLVDVHKNGSLWSLTIFKVQSACPSLPYILVLVLPGLKDEG